MERLIGLKTFKSKKGQDCYVAVIETPFTDRERSYGSMGCKAEEQFIDKDIYDTLSPADFGKEVIRDFDVSGGRAYLRDLTVCN